MNTIALIPLVVLVAGELTLRRHDIADYRAGYQVSVVDVDCDGRLVVVVLSTEANRADWFHNPDWYRRNVLMSERNIDLAPLDLDEKPGPEFEWRWAIGPRRCCRSFEQGLLV